jgi:hypothetical protein
MTNHRKCYNKNASMEQNFGENNPAVALLIFFIGLPVRHAPP